jgi:deazaflavin-dependent oxidoreductase (nitroreductase family)
MGDPEATVRTLDPPIPKPVFEYVINPLVKALLRSPLHFLASDSLVLVTFTGRKSGREFTTPVGYEQRNGTLYVTSQTDRVWWRNLRGGAPVTVRLRGGRRRGHADVVEDDDAVAEYVHGFIERHGLDSVRRLAIAVDSDDVPETETLAAGLTDTVVVRIDLDAE